MQPGQPPLYSLQFAAIAAANLFVISSLGMFYLLPLFIEAGGGSRSDVGIIMGAIGLSSVLCRPWTSDIPDKMGRKGSYTLACGLMAVVPTGFLFLSGDTGDFYFAIVLLRLAHGVALALYFTSGLTYVVDIVPSSRLNEGIGMFGAAGLAGMALGPAVAELILSRWNFQVLFAAASVTAALGLLLHLPLPGPSHSPSKEDSPSFFKLLFKGKTLVMALLSSLFGMSLASTINFVVPWAAQLQIGPASLFFISCSGSAIFIRLTGGSLADRLGERRLLPLALGLTGSGLLLLSVLNGTAVLVAAGITTGCGTGFLFPCLNVLAVRGAPSGIRGKLNGIFTGSVDAGIFTGSIILGYIGDLFGFAVLFITAGVAMYLGIIVVKRLVPLYP